jgi:integrase
LNKEGMLRLQPGERLAEHGIEYERLPDGDGVFRINIMVNGVRIHRTLGRISDGVTPKRAWECAGELRSRALHDRLGLRKGRKTDMPFAEAAERYLDELSRTNGKDLVEKGRRLSLHLIPFFGAMPLSKIDALSVDRYKTLRRGEPSLRGGIRRGADAAVRRVANADRLTSKGTINRELAVLSHLMNRAVEWGWLQSNPVRMRRFHEERTQFEYLTTEEMTRLVASAASDPHPQIHAFVMIALHSAMRAGEILSLKREFIDFDKLVIRLPTAKTGARDVPISPSLLEFLQQYLQSAAGSCWLFPAASSKSGHTEELRRPWQRIVAAAGLATRRITRHTLRHTAITHLVQAGVDLPTVQRVSGHKSFEMVFRYSHQNQQHVQDALRKLDARIIVQPTVDQHGASGESDYTGTTQNKRTYGPEEPQVLEDVGRPCRDRTYDQRIKSLSLESVILLFYQLLTASAQPDCSSRMQRIAGARKMVLLRFCIQVPKTSDVVLVLDQVTRLLARQRSAWRNCPPRIRRTFSGHDASSMPRRLLPFWLPPFAEPPDVPTTRYLRYLPSDRGRPPSVRLPQQSPSPWHPF